MAVLGPPVAMPVAPTVPPVRTAARADCVEAERRHEEARLAASREKRSETVKIDTAGEAHRAQVDATLAARKQILDSTRAVRDDMKVRLQTARKHHALETEIASRELANAGRRALDARVEAERWRAKAAEAEAHKRAIWERNEAASWRSRVGQDARLSEAAAHATAREDHGHSITAEASHAFQLLHQLHEDHCTTQEKYAGNTAQVRALGAHVAERECLAKVDWSKTQAMRSIKQSDREVRESHEEAAARVAAARQELADRHRQCQDLVAQERVCASTAKKMAAVHREAKDDDHEAHLRRLDEKLQVAMAHVSNKDVLPVERIEVAVARNEAWDVKRQQALEAARARAEREEAEAEGRVERAKAALSKLQAHCAGHINELLKQWEDAKRVDAARVQAATDKTAAVLKYCEECLERHREYSARVLEKTKDFAEAKAAQLQEKVSAIASLSEQRVAMAARQSQERRHLAEQQLENLRRHIEDVRVRCTERVRTEQVTAEEKVRIARERHDAATARAELRAREAEGARDAARRALDEVMARCHGAAAEARRRGLSDIASIIEPPEPPAPEPPMEVVIFTVDEEERLAAGPPREDEEAQDDGPGGPGPGPEGEGGPGPDEEGGPPGGGDDDGEDKNQTGTTAVPNSANVTGASLDG